MAATTHKTVVSSLTAEQRNYLTQRSDHAGLRALLIHFGLILLFTLLIVLQVPGWPVLVLPQGVLLLFLFTLLHEETHRTAFRSKPLNDALAAFCGWLLVLPPNWFRYFHFAHHRYTQHPEKDPELQSPKPATKAAYLWHISGLPVTWNNVKTLLQNARGPRAYSYVPDNATGLIRRESQLMIAAYVLVTMIALLTDTMGIVFWCWWLPLIIGQPFLRLYLMAEHGGCAFVEDMFANTRTTFTSSLIRRLAWNMPYHAEHHAYPNVPFYRLPEFHEVVKEKLKVTSDGYVEFHREVLHGLQDRVE